MFLSGLTTIVSNEEMDDIMKIIKFLEEQLNFLKNLQEKE